MEDDVELPLELLVQVIDVRADELSRYSELGAEGPCQVDRILRKIDAGDLRASPGPREGVEAEMALKVEHRAAGDVPQFGELDRLQGAAARAEAG